MGISAGIGTFIGIGMGENPSGNTGAKNACWCMYVVLM